MAKAKSKKTARKTSKKKVVRKSVKKPAARKAAKRVSKVHPLHKHVHNQTAFMAIFVALAVFFFSYNSAVQAERTAASMTQQVIVMP